MIDRPNWPGSIELKQLAEQLETAIAQRHYLQFNYSDRRGHETQRQVEPYRLVYKGERWYLQAYSIERADFRLFRLSRMQELTVMTTIFTSRAVPALNFDLPPRLQPPMVPLTIQVDNRARDQFVERFGQQVIRSQNSTGFTAQIQLPNNENAYRFILSLGTRAHILAGDTFLAGFQPYLATLTAMY